MLSTTVTKPMIASVRESNTLQYCLTILDKSAKKSDHTMRIHLALTGKLAWQSGTRLAWRGGNILRSERATAKP